MVRSLTILFVFAGGCASQQTETEEVELATMVAARWEEDASVDDSTSVYTGRSTSSDSRDTSVFIPDLLSSQPTSCDDSSETEMMADIDDDGAAGSISDHNPEEANDGAAAADDENATGDDAAAPTDAASPDAQGADITQSCCYVPNMICVLIRCFLFQVYRYSRCRINGGRHHYRNV